MGSGPAASVVLLDSVTQTAAEHAGCIVVTGSHAGRSVIKYAAAVPARLYVFNDAGIGKDGAGIAALAELEALGVAAAAVAHDSARIGEALDTWRHGVISAVNAPARRLGLAPGARLRDALAQLA
jgi:hypothetical protein